MKLAYQVAQWTPAVVGLLVGVLAAPAARAENAKAAGSFSAALESIQSGDLRKHVTHLADDTFEGREAGSRGGRAAGVYLGQELRKHQLAGGGTGGGYYQDFGKSFRNVLALLEGADPKLKQEVIVVGAHYDHVGYGAANNSRGPVGYIHNGADDNGSGTAGLLEVIEALAQLEARPKRTILFAFFDAEEKGLLGSKHWVAEPTIPLERVRMMVNMDMIGRLRERRLEVFGVRTADAWPEYLTRHNQGLDLRLKFNWEIKPNSDHHTFFSKQIPCLMLHTGLHADYHKPSDDADKLDVDGMQAVARLCFRLVSDLAERASLPSFRTRAGDETISMQQAAERALPPLPPRLGISWETPKPGELGIVAADVSAGSAAARAGVKAGDRILGYDGRELRSDADFRAHVLTVSKTLRLSIQRPTEKQPSNFEVPLDGEPTRVGVAWRVDEAEPGTAILLRVVPYSPAALGGLQVNDRIYAVAGKRFSTSDEFLARVNDAHGAVELEIGREGALRKVELKLP